MASAACFSFSQTPMQNVLGRDCQSLNGKWSILTDVMNSGIQKKWGNPVKYDDPLKLNELHYDGGMTLDVPGDWNTQRPEFLYYEAPMWYKRTFNFKKENGRRYFLHFSAVSTNAQVFLNGELIGKHKGGFTPFQFEVGERLKEGNNIVVVRVDNIRGENTIPALKFDWWNYGGITRDFNLISTPETFIEDYWVRLDEGTMEKVLVDVKLNGRNCAGQKVKIKLGGTDIIKEIKTDTEGRAFISFKTSLELWSPENPHLYDVSIESPLDKVEDKIGFRCFEVKGTEIYLNGKPLFLRGVGTHEEIAHDRRRAFSEEDADFLVNEVIALGCNFVRLVHYPHNEYMVRKCEEKGLMMWEEIPIWQSINFKNSAVCDDITYMMKEMMHRDKNRCGIVIWAVSNETLPRIKERNDYLIKLVKQCKTWDNTRAISAATNALFYDETDSTKLVLQDPLADYLDIVGVNKYMGWYLKWKDAPDKTQWITHPDKPLIITEFGAEAVYANYGDGNNINSWSENYMERVYKDNIKSFNKIPNLRGTSPWHLFDFRSPRRAHAMYQQGRNRKGLISPEGNRKRPWYVMKDYYMEKEKNKE